MGVVVDAIKSLWIKGRLRGDDELVAGIGDVIEAGPKASGRAVIDESWPGTAVATLETWHRTLGVAYDPTISVADQQNRLQAMMTAEGGVSIPALQSQINKEFPNVVVSEVEITARRGLSRYGASRYGVTANGVISSVSYRLEGSVPSSESVKRLTAILRRYGPAHMLPTSSLTYENDTIDNRFGVGRRGGSRCVPGTVTPAAPAFAVAAFIAGIANPGSTIYVYPGRVTGVPTPALTYQWKLDGTNIPGANSNSWTVITSGSYTCVVTATNSAGSASSTTSAVVTPDFAPVISSAVVLASGSMLYLDIVMDGRPTPSLSYQWRKDGLDISGQTSPTLDLTGRTPGAYQCYITAVNSQGSSSLLSGSYVATAPVITWTGALVKFVLFGNAIIAASGVSTSAAPVESRSYKWYRNGSVIYEGPNSQTSGPNTPGDQYYCILTVTNAVGVATQTSNTLTI